MLSITKTLESIFEQFIGLDKPQKKFLTELFEVIPCVQGRLNYTNMSRYSIYNEVSFRRNFSKFFDWVKLNYLILHFVFLGQKKELIGALDCSYISKSGKQTYGLAKFWSGVANKTKKGLEVSLVAVIEVAKRRAWSIDARQTPPDLSSKQGVKQEYSRIDFYMEQLSDCIIQIPEIVYYTADGFYAKVKVIETTKAHGKHLISKLRPDANLRYILDREKYPDAHGNKKYDGKVNWSALNLDKWEFIGVDERHSHLRIYTQILYSPQFKCKIRVVFLWNARTSKYALLFSTDTAQDARKIVSYYQLRFQIEFIFRDAKQFTGLTHCQARGEEALDFHFNMSFSALNLYQYQRFQSNSSKSLNSFVRKAYNTKLIKTLFQQLSTEHELKEIFNQNPCFLNLSHHTVQKIINIGQMST